MTPRRFSPGARTPHPGAAVPPPGRTLRWAAILLLLPLGLFPAAAAPTGAGSRGEGNSAIPDLCVIAPRVEARAGGTARARVPVGRPTVFVQEDLAEMVLEAEGRVLWRRLGSAAAPIRGPIAWPLAPLRPGEGRRLRLRPLGAPTGDFAVVDLEGAPAAEMTRAEALLNRLGRDPATWLRAIEGELERGDHPLAWALLFAFEGPSSPELDALRLEVYRRGCGAAGP